MARTWLGHFLTGASFFPFFNSFLSLQMGEADFWKILGNFVEENGITVNPFFPCRKSLFRTVFSGKNLHKHCFKPREQRERDTIFTSVFRKCQCDKCFFFPKSNILQRNFHFSFLCEQIGAAVINCVRCRKKKFLCLKPP